MKAIYWDDATQGMSYELEDIPADMAAECETWREQLVEAAAEGNEELLEKYLEGEALSIEEIRARHPRAHAGQRDRAGDVRLGVQEQGRAGRCWTP